jgi:exodeoxyribonuclease VII small subunit
MSLDNQDPSNQKTSTENVSKKNNSLNQDSLNFEKKLQRLEEIVQKMEKGELCLDESLKLFEEGVKLSQSCQKDLTQAEQQVQQLLGVQAQGTPLTKPFHTGEESQ